MAKIQLNSALTAIRGGIDNWVYRHLHGKTVLSRRGIRSGPITASQEEVRERMRLASLYVKAALADPVRRALYTALASRRDKPLVAIGMSDFFTPPTVDAIDVSGYQGAVNDPIVVSASDDAEVTGVNVALRAPDLTVLEQGAAVREGETWVYRATTARTEGETVTITATATDHPGHTGTNTATWS